MQQILILLSLFLVVAVGIITRKTKLLPQELGKYFNTFIFYISAPAIIFLSLITLDRNNLLLYPNFVFVNLLVVFITYLFTFIILRFFNLSTQLKKIVLYCSNGGNVVFFGYPILLSVFGKTHFNLGVLYSILAISLGDLIAFLLFSLMDNQSTKKISVLQFIKDFIYNPIVITTLIGFFVLLLNLNAPKFILDTLEIIGKTTTGLALFSFGFYLGGSFKIINLKISLIPAIIKLGILPLMTYFVTNFVFGLPAPAVQTSVMMAAMPTAVFSLVVAENFNLDKTIASGSIVFSSLFFIATSTFWLWFLLK